MGGTEHPVAGGRQTQAGHLLLGVIWVGLPGGLHCMATLLIPERPSFLCILSDYFFKCGITHLNVKHARVKDLTH